VILDILYRRGGEVRVTIGDDVVMKECLGYNKVQHVYELITIYNSLKRKNVPHVDALHSFDLNDDTPRVFLKPVGVATYPYSGSEAFSAVVCVLKALEVRYGIPVFIF
jgi:hypothetical protein